MSTIERLAEQADMDWQGYALDVIHNWSCSTELEDVINSDTGREIESLVAIAFERLADQINEEHAAAIAQAHAEYAELERRNAELVEALQRMVDNAIASCDGEDDGTYSVSMTEQEWGDHCAATDAACLALAHSAQEKADAQ